MSKVDMGQFRSSNKNSSVYDDLRSEEKHLELFSQFINKYPPIQKAVNEGNFRLNNTIVTEPRGWDITFQCEINNGTTSNWWNKSFLEKPQDQRGSITDGLVTGKTRRKWNKCYLDSLLNHRVTQYVFSFSDYWNGAWLTNGATRINHRESWSDPQHPTVHLIDFDYYFPLQDLTTGEYGDINLKGSESLKEIINSIGLVNWEDKQENLFHQVDIHWFRHETEFEARKEHSIVFRQSNDNLRPIDTIHSEYTPVNLNLRPECSWYGYDHGTLSEGFKKLWPYNPKNKNFKKAYTNSVPYEVGLRTLKIFLEGFCDTSIEDLDVFVTTHELDHDDINGKNDELFTSYLETFEKFADWYLKLWKIDKNTFPIQKTRVVEFFTLFMTIQKWDAVNGQLMGVTDMDKFNQALSKVIPYLKYQSEFEHGNGIGTIYKLRGFTTNEWALRDLTSMILDRVRMGGNEKIIVGKNGKKYTAIWKWEADTVAKLDPKRKASTKDKEYFPNECTITGQPVPSSTKLQYHHTYTYHRNGGKTDVTNNLPVLEVVNHEIEKEGWKRTSDYIKDRLINNPGIFTPDKIDYWNNGGMDKLVHRELSNDYKYGLDMVIEKLHNTRKLLG